MKSILAGLEPALQLVVTATIYTIVTVALLGIAYPIAIAGLARIAFPHQANGSLVIVRGKIVGSALVGQSWTAPQYFHGRPSAAGKNGYDPTATGGTNLGPSSKKLVDATRAAIAALEKENPDARLAIPMDLVTSSASGIDPDISPDAVAYQIPRVARARRLSRTTVAAIVAESIREREAGFLGEPRVNVLELNLALDAKRRSGSFERENVR